MMLTIEPTGVNNFHDCKSINVRVSELAKNTGENCPLYKISTAVAKRIQKHFCGVTGCGCPAGGVVIQLNMDGTEWGVAKRN